MKCPACGYENPEGAKFCDDCAAGIEQSCPQEILPDDCLPSQQF
jgi:hypothetical protein